MIRRLDEVLREHVQSALVYFEHNIPRTAKALGVGRATLYKWVASWRKGTKPKVSFGPIMVEKPKSDDL